MTNVLEIYEHSRLALVSIVLFPVTNDCHEASIIYLRHKNKFVFSCETFKLRCIHDEGYNIIDIIWSLKSL